MDEEVSLVRIWLGEYQPLVAKTDISWLARRQSPFESLVEAHGEVGGERLGK